MSVSSGVINIVRTNFLLLNSLALLRLRNKFILYPL